MTVARHLCPHCNKMVKTFPEARAVEEGKREKELGASPTPDLDNVFDIHMHEGEECLGTHTVYVPPERHKNQCMAEPEAIRPVPEMTAREYQIWRRKKKRKV